MNRRQICRKVWFWLLSALPAAFGLGAYHASKGYGYRSWSYGERLPAICFSRDYWISDYNSYELMASPEGYVWVRFGPDGLHPVRMTPA